MTHNITRHNITRRSILAAVPAAALAPGAAVALPAATTEEQEMAETWERLRLFCEWTGETPPATIVDAEDAPTTEFLEFAWRTGLSLDWVFMGEVRPLLMGCYKRATSPETA